MCWRTLDEAAENGNAPELEIYEETIQVDGEDVVVLDDGLLNNQGQDDGYYPWFFMLDKGTDMDDNENGTQSFGQYYKETVFLGRVTDQDQNYFEGYHHAPGDVNWSDFPDNKEQVYNTYFGAKFTNAVANTEYKTSMLTIEAYHL